MGRQLKSDMVTQGVRVQAVAFYLPEESDPQEGRFNFGYQITITNESKERVQLVSRHWIIIDGDGNRREVRGPGVVGQTPHIDPGQSYRYNSFCPMDTNWGTMEGEYEMRRDNGETFQVNVGRFFLTTDEAAAPAAKPGR